MNKKMLSIIGLVTVVLFSVIGFMQVNKNSNANATDEIEVFLTRTCGCCKKWVEHLNSNGLKTKLTYLDDLTEVKRQNKVPSKLGSCHTAVVSGYVVEGHVPAASVKKMLSEKPKIKGIAVPGMPMGSPGMEGPYTDKYDVVSFDEKENLSVYDSY